MNNKIIKKIMYFVIIAFMVLNVKNVYGYNINYNSSEFLNREPKSTGTPIPDTPDAPNNDYDEIIPVVQNDHLVGNIYETVEAIDSQNLGTENSDSSRNARGEGISEIPVELYLNNNLIATSKTSNNGYYSFDITSIPAGSYNYTVKYTYPGVTQSDIDKIKSANDAKEIQKKLKYNAQDYISSSEAKATSIKYKGTGAAEIFLLLDYSASMNDTITVGNNQYKKIDIQKAVAKTLVNNLITDDSNIYIGLIIFKGSSRKMVSLTNDKNVLIKGIEESDEKNVKYQSYTNIISALDKATSDTNVGFTGTQNRFIFLLSDGIPTWDGSSSNILFRTDSAIDGNSARVQAENDAKLDRIFENTKNKLEELENDGVTIYSIISNFDLDTDLQQKLKYIYLENKNDVYNKYQEIENFSDLATITKFINDFKNYVKNSVKIVESDYNISTQDRGIDFKDTYSEFTYRNTEYYQALNMEINNKNSIDQFKKYAKELLENTQVTKQNSGKVDIRHDILPEETVQYITVGGKTKTIKYELKNMDLNAVDVYLEPIQSYTLNPTITATGIKIIAQNGANLINESKPFNILNNNKSPLYVTIDEQHIYGAKLIIEYTLNVINKSVINNTNKTTLLFHVPDGFTFENDSEIVIEGIYKDDQHVNLQLIGSPIEINKNNVEILRNNLLISNELADYIKKDHSAIALTIQTDTENFKLLTNGQIQTKLYVSKTLSYDVDDLVYNTDLEILGYSNNTYRRLQYKSNETHSLLGAIAANNNLAEGDLDTSNETILLYPTGKDKSMKTIYIVLIILVITAISILLILIKLNNKKQKNK